MLNGTTSISSLDENSLGRPTLNCRTFLRDPVDFPLLSSVVNSGLGAPVVVVELDAATYGALAVPDRLGS